MTIEKATGEKAKGISRRKALRLLGGSAALIPVINLTGCGEEPQPETAAPQPAQAPKSVPPTPKQEPKQEKAPMDAGSMEAAAPPSTAAPAELPKVSLDDPQAKALAYVHDASAVDAASQPRFKPGQACKNCALYSGGDKPWGGCGIFAGRAVSAEGWCTAYAPKPS
jgi:hypothetical protein